MNQEIWVGLIVVTAALYASWRMMPAAWRQGLAARVAQAGRRLGLSETQTRQLMGKLENSSGCGSCKACATPAANLKRKSD